jgi:hypothetical protein
MMKHRVDLDVQTNMLELLRHVWLDIGVWSTESVRANLSCDNVGEDAPIRGDNRGRSVIARSLDTENKEWFVRSVRRGGECARIEVRGTQHTSERHVSVSQFELDAATETTPDAESRCRGTFFCFGRTDTFTRLLLYLKLVALTRVTARSSVLLPRTFILDAIIALVAAIASAPRECASSLARVCDAVILVIAAVRHRRSRDRCHGRSQGFRPF